MYLDVTGKICRTVLFFFSVLNAQEVLALNENNSSLPSKPLRDYVITLSAGPVWIGSGETQTLLLQPDVQKTYTANTDTPSLGQGALFLGVQQVLNSRFFGQAGFEIETTGNARLSGDIWDDANPGENNFFYNYTIQHVHLALKGKLLMDTGHTLSPYVAGSVGVGYNRDSQFIIIPRGAENVPAPSFLSHTQTGFTYTLGLGVQKTITNHWQASLGYEFADWGKNNLAPAPGQTVGQGLSLNHLYTRQLQFSLGYTV